MAGWRDAADRVLGSRVVAGAGWRLTKHRLRVLAYHGVHDAASFSRHLEYLRAHTTPVSAADVVAALTGAGKLPPRPVWMTFDDGDPTVVENALPLLERHGVPATMFVCPGLVDDDEPFWWQTVEAASDAARGGRAASAVVAELKTVADDQRRAAVAHIAGRHSVRRPQITSAMLRRFVAAGGTLGNHSWDHPLVDRCAPDVVREQITKAHRWLAEFDTEPRLFAYPNGNYSPAAEEVLADLGYAAGLLFDHRLAALGGSPWRLSRLRVNDYTSSRRFAAIVSGVHPWLHQRRLRSSQ